MGLGIYTVNFFIYTVDYIFQHAFSTLALFGLKYSRGAHTRQVPAISSNLILQTIPSTYSSRRIKLQYSLAEVTVNRR